MILQTTFSHQKISSFFFLPWRRIKSEKKLPGVSGSQSRRVSEEWKSHVLVEGVFWSFQQRQGTCVTCRTVLFILWDARQTPATHTLLLRPHMENEGKRGPTFVWGSNLSQNPGSWWHHRDRCCAWVLESNTWAWNLTPVCATFDL